MTVFTDNAEAFATRPDQRVRELRRSHIGIAVEFLALGDPAGALATMTDCLDAQARVSGLRQATTCPHDTRSE